MGEGRRKTRWLGVVVACALAGLAACSQASSSSAKKPGDDVIIDMDGEASAMLPQPDAADYDDGFFNGTDGPYGSGYGDSSGGYAVLTICPPPDASAGGSGDASAAADSSAVTYSDAAVAYGDAGSGTYGSTGAASCTPIPAACVSEPNCTCLLTALKSSLQCTYPHCDDGMAAGFTIFCPP